MRNVTTAESNRRRCSVRLHLFAILCIGVCNAQVGLAQSDQYPFTYNYPSGENEPKREVIAVGKTPLLAQKPLSPRKSPVYQLPPPTVFSDDPVTLSPDYAEVARPSSNRTFQLANPSDAYAMSEPQETAMQQESFETIASPEESTSSEIVIAEGLGPTVQEDSWIHGSWKSFCKAGCMVGIEGTFLAIQTDSLRSVVATDLIEPQTLEKAPRDGFGAGYRTWFGMQTEVVGFKVTYWNFENSYYEPTPGFVPWNSFAFFDSNMLKAQTIDVEFLQRFCLHQSWLETSLGARYASLDRSGLLQGAGKLGGLNLLGSAATNSELEGWGGVASIGGWIPIFCKDDLAPGCYNPWAFFWKCQGSALQAQSKVQAITLVNAISGNDKFANAYSKDEAIADWQGMIGLGMLQVGLDYRCPVSWIDCQPAAIHLRSGFEGQYWQTGDVGARSQSGATLAGDFNNVPFGSSIVTRADTNPEDLVMLGFFVSASLSY